MEKINLTERGIAALKPAAPGKRYEVFDVQVPGLGLRINHKPKLKMRRGEAGAELAVPQGQFILYAPAQKGKAAVRRWLGPIIGMTLAEARSQALDLRKLLAAGVDPAKEAAKKKRAEADHAAETFGAAMELYLKRVDKQRRGAGTRADIERDLLPFWKDRPLREITKRDIRDRVLEIAEGKNRGKLAGKKTKKRGASPRQARVALGNLKTFFGWAEEHYDLTSVPTDGRGLNKLIPTTKARQRILSDDEIYAYWIAAEESEPPLKQGYQILMLSGARYSEIFDAQYPELNKKQDLLTVPPERFKSDAEHLIPLTQWAREIIATVPKWKDCRFIFSRDGKTAASVWTKDRERLSERMLAILRRLAEDRGEDPDNIELRPFVLHDVRRTVRTRLSALKVEEEIAELIIGHGRKGLQRIYNLHRAEAEMREALALWGQKLREIVKLAPQPAGNVVSISSRRDA